MNSIRSAAFVLFVSLVASGATAADPAPIVVRLPFPEGAAWKVLPRDPADDKDVGGKFVVEFAMTDGSQVAAAMDGVVEFVKADEKGQSERRTDDNKVVVRHEDGSVAEYVHLQKNGALVEVGERVVAGDVIGLSGDVGKCASPRLRFGLRVQDKDGPSVPLKFVEVADAGVPAADALVTSQNVAVRSQYGWRAMRDAVDLYKMCAQIGCRGVALPLLVAAKKTEPKIKHPSFDALMKERDETLETHRLSAGDALTALKIAKEAKEFDAVAAFATFGPSDYADIPAVAKEMKQLSTTYGKDPAWADSVARTALRAEFRKLVGDAIKEETSAGSRFIPKKSDPRARPDYTAAVTAWERARGRAPDPDQGSMVRRHGESLKKAR